MSKIYNQTKPHGFLLISTLVVLSILITIVVFYLNAIIQEVQINTITREAPQAYYLAEAGIAEAVWKLQNDAAWKNSFTTDPGWSASFTRNNALLPGASFTVTVSNVDLADALIIATSTIPVRDTAVTRVVQANVYRALNDLPTDNAAVYADNDILSVGGRFNITGGDLFANHNINLTLFSDWTASGAAKAVNSITTSLGSTLTASGAFDATHSPPPSALQMPALDFDSADPASYKSRAGQIYTNGEFSQLLHDNPNLTLNGITYVTGNVHIKKGDNLTVNGALVADGTVTVGNGFSSASSPATLDINHSGSEPSGLLAKGNVIFGGYSSAITIDGLLYAGGRWRIQDGIQQDVGININGGVIADDIEVYAAWITQNITLNQNYIAQALGTPLFSPVILINHWEEKY